MQRQTKITATLGPATDAPGALAHLFEVGVNVVRMNFSHGDADEHRKRVNRVREIAREKQIAVGVLADLQGPKIRIDSFREGSITLVDGQNFVLDTALDENAGTNLEVGVGYKELPKDVRAGNELLLSDGAISLQVHTVKGTRISCKVLSGGALSGRQGLNLRGGGLSATGLTEKDHEDIHLAAELDVDFLAVSFVVSATDIQTARQLLRDAGGQARIVAKIERAEAVDNLESIIAASDAVMVARGDLGVEIGDAELPAVQKRIISLAREGNRLVITATQMMESMREAPTPTRAEVMDVANAVLDGTDSVMLSAETAMGAYPVKAVAAMARICAGAERGQTAQRSVAQIRAHFQHTDEAIAMAVMYTAEHMEAHAIIALTESGNTAMLMSRQDTHVPIYALTQYPRTVNYLALCRGVYPVLFTPSDLVGLTPVHEAIHCLKSRGKLADGDRVLITKGDFTGPGGTNEMKVVTVGEL